MQKFAHIRKMFWGRHFWARGYLAVSSGNIANDMIQKYNEFLNRLVIMQKRYLSSSVVTLIFNSVFIGLFILAFRLSAQCSVSIESLSKYPGIIRVLSENDIDGVKNFIVLRPYLDKQLSVNAIPTDWPSMRRHIIYATGILIAGILGRTCTGKAASWLYHVSREQRLYYCSYWKSNLAKILYYNFRCMNDNRVPLVLGILASFYPFYKIARYVSPPIVYKIESFFYKSRLNKQEINALPSWLREPVSKHFSCEPENLIWYVDDCLPLLQND